VTPPTSWAGRPADRSSLRLRCCLSARRGPLRCGPRRRLRLGSANGLQFRCLGGGLAPQVLDLIAVLRPGLIEVGAYLVTLGAQIPDGFSVFAPQLLADRRVLGALFGEIGAYLVALGSQVLEAAAELG
jgi:hypothetical protein